MANKRLTYRDYARYARMTDEDLERDCVMSAFHASGPGGQGVNTSDSAVRLKHLPTGIVVTSREQRSQLQNRMTCLKKLRALLIERAKPPKRRIATKPTQGSVMRRLDTKRRRSDVKATRKPPRIDE